MITHLFDTSAVVHYYLPVGNKTQRLRARVKYLVEQRTVYRRAALFIPSFCIAEAFNTFAKLHFRPGPDDRPLSGDEYAACLKNFRQDIHWEKTFYSYDLNRNHILAADEIIPIEHNMPPAEPPRHLSTLDILVIAMACELAYIGDPDQVYLITRDRRMKDVFQMLKEFPIQKRRELQVERPMGEPEAKRWAAPKVLLLQSAAPAEFPRVTGQPALNVR
jgi:hypothetical protein